MTFFTSHKKTIRVLCMLLILALTLPLFASCDGISSESDPVKRAIATMWKEKKGNDSTVPSVRASSAVSGYGYDTLALCMNTNTPVLILVDTTGGSAEILPTKLYVRSIFEGLYQDGTEADKLVRTFADCYKKYGDDAFNNPYGIGYGDLLNALCQLSSLKKCRQYVLTSMVNETEYDVLFKTGSPELSCIVTTEQVEKYNWSSVPENIAKYYYNTDRSTYYALELNLGPAYSLVTHYVAYPILIDRKTEELTVSENKRDFNTMSDLKKSLGAEEFK